MVCDFDENQQKRWIQNRRDVNCVNDYYGHGQGPLEIRALQLSQQSPVIWSVFIQGIANANANKMIAWIVKCE